MKGHSKAVLLLKLLFRVQLFHELLKALCLVEVGS